MSNVLVPGGVQAEIAKFKNVLADADAAGKRAEDQPDAQQCEARAYNKELRGIITRLEGQLQSLQVWLQSFLKTQKHSYGLRVTWQ